VGLPTVGIAGTESGAPALLVPPRPQPVPPADDPTAFPGPLPPNHLQLPDSDGKPVDNFFEHPQAIILTESLVPFLRRRCPDGRYAIGQSSGIYWRWRANEPPLDACKAPDWYLVLDVPPMLDGQYRRSYVLAYEGVAPLLLLEFVSGDGQEERDRTPGTGKFWVYEKGIRAPYYGIYDPQRGQLNCFALVAGDCVPLSPNERGHFAFPPLGLELGLVEGEFLGMRLPWLRWFENGELLPMGDERAEQEKQRAEQEKQRAEQEKQRADEEQNKAERLAARLRSLGIDPKTV